MQLDSLCCLGGYFVMNEIWKECINGRYLVSNLGNVKMNIPNKKHRKPYKATTGYNVISIVESGKTKIYSIHRLVANAFIENPLNKKFVNHINGIKTDNKIENLEWCTRLENERHAWATGLNESVRVAARKMCQSRIGVNHPSSKPVVNILSGKVYESVLEAIKKENIPSTCLHRSLKRSDKKYNIIYLHRHEILL